MPSLPSTQYPVMASQRNGYNLLSPSLKWFTLSLPLVYDHASAVGSSIEHWRSDFHLTFQKIFVYGFYDWQNIDSINTSYIHTCNNCMMLYWTFEFIALNFGGPLLFDVQCNCFYLTIIWITWHSFYCF